MSHRTNASRLRRMGVIALPAVVAALALAPAANAQPPATVVYTPGSPCNASATTNGSALQTAVTDADGNAAGTQNIIQLTPGCLYEPSAPMTLGNGTNAVNIEITGSPTYQVPAGAQDTNVNGGLANPIQTSLFTVDPEATVLFKGFDIAGAGTEGSAAILVDGTHVGGTSPGVAEIDNMGVDGEVGGGVYVSAGGNATINNSLIGDNTADGVEDNGGTVILNQDTIYGNGTYGLDGTAANNAPTGNVVLNNTLLTDNNQNGVSATDCGKIPAGGISAISAASSTAGSMADDSSCGTGVTQKTSAQIGLSAGVASPYNGGPVFSAQLPAGSLAIGADNSTSQYCGIYDERFFVRGATCDVGSYQTSASQDTTPDAPVCKALEPNYATNPATQTADVADSGVGLGPDAISAPAISPSTGANVTWPTQGVIGTSTTASGAQGLPTSTLNVASTTGFPAAGMLFVQSSTGEQTLSYTGTTSTTFTGVTGGTGTVSSGATVYQDVPTAFQLTNPGAPIMSMLDWPAVGSLGPPSAGKLFPVTANKMAGDTTVGDTHWSFTATNWLGIQTVCS